MQLTTLDWIIVVVSIVALVRAGGLAGAPGRVEHRRVLHVGPRGAVVADRRVDGGDDVQHRHAQPRHQPRARGRRRRQLGVVGVPAHRHDDGVLLRHACGGGSACSPTSSSTRCATRAAPRRWVRGFRAVYLGLFFNVVIMATVNLAAAKIANVLLGWPMGQTLARRAPSSTSRLPPTSGLWGVLVTDFIQFGIAMTGSFAAAVLRAAAAGGRRARRPDREDRPEGARRCCRTSSDWRRRWPSSSCR